MMKHPLEDLNPSICDPLRPSVSSPVKNCRAAKMIIETQMTRRPILLAALFLLGIVALGRLMLNNPALADDKPSKKINVLVVTGGHEFDPKKFFKLLDDIPEITYT